MIDLYKSKQSHKLFFLKTNQTEKDYPDVKEKYSRFKYVRNGGLGRGCQR